MALGLPLPHSLGSWKAKCSSDAELSLSSLEECRRDALGRKGVKGLSLVGQEKKVPRGFGLRTGDPGGSTADGAGNRGRPASRAPITGKNQGGHLSHGLLFLFLRYGSPARAKQRRKDCVCL